MKDFIKEGMEVCPECQDGTLSVEGLSLGEGREFVSLGLHCPNCETSFDVTYKLANVFNEETQELYEVVE